MGDVLNKQGHQLALSFFGGSCRIIRRTNLKAVARWFRSAHHQASRRSKNDAPIPLIPGRQRKNKEQHRGIGVWAENTSPIRSKPEYFPARSMPVLRKPPRDDSERDRPRKLGKQIAGARKMLPELKRD
jgi:hypothetical protein